MQEAAAPSDPSHEATSALHSDVKGSERRGQIKWDREAAGWPVHGEGQ